MATKKNNSATLRVLVTLIVTSTVGMRDKVTKKVLAQGDTLTTEDIARVNDLVKRGICEIKGFSTPTEEAQNPNPDGNPNAEGE